DGRLRHCRLGVRATRLDHARARRGARGPAQGSRGRGRRGRQSRRRGRGAGAAAAQRPRQGAAGARGGDPPRAAGQDGVRAEGGPRPAGWGVERLRLITAERDAATEEQLMEVAVGAGADDYRDDGDVWTVQTPPNDLDKVTAALEAANLSVQSSKIGFVPKAR